MTKQELIQQAYGDKYNELKSNINDHGYIRRVITGRGRTNGMEYEKFGFKRDDLDLLSFTSDGVYSWRPKALRGIETNNGWTCIETDPSNLQVGVFEFLLKQEYSPDPPERIIDTIHVNEALIKTPDMAWYIYSHFRPTKQEVYPLYDKL